MIIDYILSHLLTILIFLPLAGVGLIFLVNADDKTSKIIALSVTLLNFALSLLLWTGFYNGTEGFQFIEQYNWFGENSNISYHVGVDGISLFMVILTTFLMPLCILCSWESITKRVREFVIAFLVILGLVKK